MKWLVDASMQSGLLIENNNNALEYVYPFDALFTVLGGQISNLENSYLLPFGLPKILDLRLKPDVKIKNDLYKFRSTLDGRRLQITIDDLKPWLVEFDRLILPFEMASIDLPSNIDVYVDVSKSSKLESLKLNNIGAALDFDLLGLTKVIEITKLLVVDSFYVFGDLSIEDIKSLSHINNLIIQSNTPLEQAMSGFCSIENKLVSIIEPHYEQDQKSLIDNCQCFTCLKHTRSYLHHLYKNTPILAIQLLAKHNMHVWQSVF